jgi:PPOX class probable FMN-dependent enzyme
MADDLEATGFITTEDDLLAHYGQPVAGALKKEIDHVNAPYRAFIERSPLCLFASVAPEGLDCSPRGDPAGFVRVLDERTLLIPDRRGNNRIDTLRNIVRDGRVALLFMIPGIGETLRVNGRASISVDETLRASFAIGDKVPATVIVVHVDRVYFQCQKALARSQLWEPEARAARSEVPTTGEMVKAVIEGFDADTYDANYPEHMKRTIY